VSAPSFSAHPRHLLADLGPCAAALLAACGAADAPAPRNAILISIDTLRPDHLGCYGHERDTSPALDALAARGVRFADATAAAPWTLPAHATMLTGLYPSHHGVKDHETRLPDAVVTLAEEFAARRFRTLGVVNTWNVGAPQFQLAQGFQRFHYVPETEEDEQTLRMRTRNGARDVIARAREFLLADGGEEPFFLFLHFYDAHTDFTPRAPYRERFVEPYQGRLTGRTQQLVALRDKGERFAPDDLRWLRQMYDAEIRQLDDTLGRFLAWLDDRGWLASSLVVVTSDHGEEFQEHGGILHGRTQYQEVLRVPLLVAGPGVPAGVVIDTPVHGVDVVPTMLACMGIPVGTARDGLDLSVLWRGGSLPERALFAEADHTNQVEGEHVLDVKHMIRRGARKLHFDRHARSAQLFDLERDPRESTDLAAGEPEATRALLAELERFRAGAVVPESIPRPSLEERRLLDELGYAGGEGGANEVEGDGSSSED
jgi:arylsulfatase A-like enzyme